MSTATLKPGTRVNASAYTGQHGTITGEHHREPAYRHAITGDPMPETVWYDVRLDDGTRELLDASRFTLADGFDCATCRTTQDDAEREYRPDLDVPHVHCRKCDAAVIDNDPRCTWCGAATADPMPGTFTAWLGDREAVYAPYSAPPSAATVPAGCPRGLGEGLTREERRAIDPLRPSPDAAADLIDAIESGFSWLQVAVRDLMGTTDCPDGCVVESDGHCAHGFRSSALTAGMV